MASQNILSALLKGVYWRMRFKWRLMFDREFQKTVWFFETLLTMRCERLKQHVKDCPLCSATNEEELVEGKNLCPIGRDLWVNAMAVACLLDDLGKEGK